MSERLHRLKNPVTGRKYRPASRHHLPSPSSHQTASPIHHRRRRPISSTKVLHRCSSEPILWSADDEIHRDLIDGGFYRPVTCDNVLASSPALMIPSPMTSEGYKKDAKVVVNVIVEGSPGPIRTMVRLGSSVDETISLVVKRYGEEGRSPMIDRDATSFFELHHSYFSLESLDKSEVIGDIGSRSFYLRTSNKQASDSFVSEIVSARDSSPPPSPFFFISAFISRKLCKIIRRTRKLWKVLGCMQ